jgi:hypothetical protein
MIDMLFSSADMKESSWSTGHTQGVLAYQNCLY